MNKKIVPIPLLFLIIGIALIIQTPPIFGKTRLSNQDDQSQNGDCVTIDQNRFEINNVRFEVKGFNYYHRAENWINFWPYWHTPEGKASIEAELILAQAVGSNTIRIFLTHDYFHDGAGAVLPEAKEDLHHFLALADQLNLKVFITLFDQMPVGSDEAKISQYSKIAESQSILDSLITPFESDGKTVHFASDCRILGWDIKNEIDRDYQFDTNEDGVVSDGDRLTVETWGVTLITYLKERVIHPVSISTYSIQNDQYDVSGVAPFLPHISYISMHYYHYDIDFPAALDETISFAQGIPVLLQETGIQSTVTTPEGSRDERDQAAYLNTILSLSKSRQIAGSLIWTLVDFDRVPADIALETPDVIYMGIVKYDADTATYEPKAAHSVVAAHFEPDVVYLDRFASYADPNACDLGVIGWRHNAAAQISACPPENPSVRVFRPHGAGQMRVTKLAPDNSDRPGLIYSPTVSPTVQLDTMRIDFSISNYSIEDRVDLSGNISLDVGLILSQASEPIWIVEGIDPAAASSDYMLMFWDGLAGAGIPATPQPFELILRLNSIDEGKNGYSAGFEIDEIKITSIPIHQINLPLYSRQAGS